MDVHTEPADLKPRSPPISFGIVATRLINTNSIALEGSLGIEWAIMYGNAVGTFRMESNEMVMKRGPERLR